MRALDLIRRVAPGRRVVAIVGGGGKTSLLFALASDARDAGLSALVTTTTRIYDPRDEHRSFDSMVLEARWADDYARIALPSALGLRAGVRVPAGGHTSGFVAVLGAGVEGGKLVSIHPRLVDSSPEDWDMVLVEADGARHRPVKAPADHEPVIPLASDVVCAVVGLDCVGAPLDDDHAFRPELIAEVAGLAYGARITGNAIAALCASPRGCFKGTPDGAIRVLVLNKADTMAADAAREVAAVVFATGAVDAVAIATLGSESADGRIREFADSRGGMAFLL